MKKRWIYFIGDKPSKHNLSPDIAFVGTKSHQTLKKWFNYISLPESSVKLLNKDKINQIPTDSIVIALGNEAEKYLKLAKIPHFKLPHPSGLNRLLNDKNWLTGQLNACKQYILKNM